MPRWAEIIGLVGIALLVVLGILVFAKLRTQEATEGLTEADEMLARSRAIPSLPPGLLDVSVTRPERRPDPESVEAAAAEGIAAGSAALGAPNRSQADAVGKAPVGVELAADITQAHNTALLPDAVAPLADVDLALLEDVVLDDAALDAQLADVEVSDTPETTDARADAADRTLQALKDGRAQPGSAEELNLLRDAEASLARLHAVRLRGDIPREVVEAEAKRLEAILGRLPERTRAEVNRMMDAGYRRAVEGVGYDSPSGGVTRGQGLDPVDDRPADLRGVSDRVRTMEKKMGVAPTPPVPTRAAPTNPSELPSVGATPF